MNLYHFTGGPCAELAALAQVVSQGESPELIVAVGNNSRGVLPPCGRCRQVLLDNFPAVRIVISNDGDIKTSEELLPFTYRYSEQ